MSPNDQLHRNVGLAFYGVTPTPESAEAFYVDLISWFDDANCPPDKLAVHASGFSGKYIGFSRGHARLLKRGFAELSGFTVTSSLPGVAPAVDATATAALDLGVGKASYFAFAAKGSVCAHGAERWSKLIVASVSQLRPDYGIGFTRAGEEIPWYFAAGLGAGEDDEESLAIGRWGDIGMVKEVYQQGVIRDVFLDNFLTKQQLNRPTGSSTLEEWILADSSRGTLSRLDRRMVQWKVKPSRIEPVRSQLKSLKAVFDWRSYLGE